MKVICDRAALLDAINLVSGVVSARTPRPQLTCVKVTATRDGGAGELQLAATDAEISLTLALGQVSVEEPGEALIPAATLRQIVSAEEHEPSLTLESDGDICHIRGQDAHFQLHGFPPAEFPRLPEFDAIVQGKGGQPPAKAVFTQSAGTLSQLISRTVFATARENSRYAINGVLVKRDGKRLELVATDGRRLALSRAQLGDAGGEPVTCIVPTKALNTLQKLIEDADEPVTLAITDNQIVFRFGDGDDESRAVLSSNLVEGTFPPYEDVIPKDQDIKVTFDRDVLASAVRRAALLTNEESRGVRMSFASGEKRLKLSSRAPEMGEATVTVDLAGMDGGDIEIGFNPAFLTDALKVISDPSVVMELKAPNKPGLFKSGQDFVYVVMPVNLQ